MEIGGDGLHSSEDDRFSVDNIRISTTPTFHIQNVDGHSQIRARSSSLESLPGIHRDAPERSQSSLSHSVATPDEAVSNKIGVHQSGVKPKGKLNDLKFLCPHGKKELESISLPGTLRKKRTNSTDSCRGSNNCYIKTSADLKNLTARIEKGCPKSRTAVMRQASDDEFLLSGEKTEVESENGTQPPYPEIKIQVDNTDQDEAI